MNKTAIALFMLLLITGCGIGGNNQDQEGQHPIGVKNSSPEMVDRKTGEAISRHLNELATRVPHVNGATSVVLGPYAVVGIDINSNVERSQAGTIKYSVAESLKNDPYGARAIVIADPDLNTRLKEISHDVQNGRPVQGILEELADITGRLMPEVPPNENRMNPKNATEKPKKTMPKKERDELQKEQKDESNQYKK